MSNNKQDNKNDKGDDLEKQKAPTTRAKQKGHFKFISDGYNEDAFIVTSFKGTEGISQLYDFEITVVTQLPDSDADLTEEEKETIDIVSSETLLINPAVFIIKHPDVFRDAYEKDYADITSEGATYASLFDKIKGSFKDTKNAYFYGYPVSCAQTTKVKNWTYYTIRLRPSFDKLKAITQNTIFTGKSVIEIVESVLDSSTTVPINYTFDTVEDTFPKQEFSLQNNEALFNYVSAKIEYDGIYYFYSQDNKVEEVIFMNDKLKQDNNSEVSDVYYQPLVSANDKFKGDIVTSFIEMRTAVPKTVFLRDYDWINPNNPVQASAPISETGVGEVYLYGEGFTSEDEGTRLAEIRAEEILCQSYNYSGTSAIPKLSPGYFFNMTNHFSTRLNAEYMVTEVSHEGSQESAVCRILGLPIRRGEEAIYYRNTFKSIPSFVQYRPQRVTERRSASGVVSGFISSVAGDDTKADTDSYGRYKVNFPQTTKVSDSPLTCMLRRAQPAVSTQSGSLSILYPGTEVLVSFLGGNPDNPIILSAVNNTETSFSGQEGTGMSDINMNEILMNDLGLRLQYGGGLSQTTTAQDNLTSYDNATNIINGLNTGFATLSSTAASSYAAMLSVNTTKKMLALKMAGPVVSAAGQAVSAVSASSKIAEGFGLGLETLGKILPIAFTLEAKRAAHAAGACAYRTTVACGKESSTIALEAHLNIPAFTTMIASIAGHIVTSVVSTGLSNSDSAETYEGYDEAIANAEASVAAGSADTSDIDAMIADIDVKLAEENLSDSERAVLQAEKEYWEAQKSALESAPANAQATIEDKTYEKHMLKAKQILPNVATMITEAVALGVLIYTKMMQNAKARGGINIASGDNNIAIGAREEVRLVSAEQVFIAANTGLNAMATSQLEDMYKATHCEFWGAPQTTVGIPIKSGIPVQVNRIMNKPPGTETKLADSRIAMVSPHILSGAEKVNRMISLDELTINSVNKIHITNQSENLIIAGTEEFITMTGKAGKGTKASGRLTYPLSEILMDNTGSSESVFSAYTLHSSTDANRLSYALDKTVLSHETDLSYSLLNLNEEYSELSYSAGSSANENTALKLQESLVTLEAADAKVLLDSTDGKVTIIADNATKIILNAGGDITTEAKSITTTATGDVSIKGDSFTAIGGQAGVKLSGSECKVTSDFKTTGSLAHLC